MNLRTMTDFNVDHNLCRDIFKMNRFKVKRKLMNMARLEGEKTGITGIPTIAPDGTHLQPSSTKENLVMRSWRDILTKSQLRLNSTYDT